MAVNGQCDPVGVAKKSRILGVAQPSTAVMEGIRLSVVLSLSMISSFAESICSVTAMDSSNDAVRVRLSVNSGATMRSRAPVVSGT